MGVGFGSDDKKLFLEELYGLESSTASSPYRGSEIIQFCRWTAAAREQKVSLALIYTAATYALGRGRTHGLCEMKMHVAEHVRHAGIVLKEISAQIVPEKIPLGHSYYLRDPTPCLFMVELEQVCRVLRERVRPIITPMAP